MSQDDRNLSNLYCEATGQPSPDDFKKFADFFVDLIVKLEQGDKEAERLLNLPIEQIIQELEQTKTVQTEAFENIRSKVGGFLGGATPLTRRYQMFVSQMNKRLWEFEQDLQTSGSENIQRFNNLMNQLQMIDPAFKAEGGTLQKAGYKVGKVAGKVGQIAGVGLIASTLSGIGLPAAAIGGIIGGGLSFLKNADKTTMSVGEKLKKVLISAGLGTMTGYALGELRDAMNIHSANADAAQIEQGGPSGENVDKLISDTELELSNMARQNPDGFTASEITNGLKDFMGAKGYNITDVSVDNDGLLTYTTDKGVTGNFTLRSIPKNLTNYLHANTQ